MAMDVLTVNEIEPYWSIFKWLTHLSLWTSH